MKVTLTDETWISKSALNQKQKKKKRTSIRQGSLACKYSLPLTRLCLKGDVWTLGMRSLRDAEHHIQAQLPTPGDLLRLISHCPPVPPSFVWLHFQEYAVDTVAPGCYRPSPAFPSVISNTFASQYPALTSHDFVWLCVLFLIPTCPLPINSSLTNIYSSPS